MRTRTILISLGLLGACSFGEGEYVEAADGLVSVEELRFDGSGTGELLRIASDEDGVLIDFQLDGNPGALQLHDAAHVFSGEDFSTATLRSWDGEAWRDQPVGLRVISSSSIGGRETAGWLVGRVRMDIVVAGGKALDDEVRLDPVSQPSESFEAAVPIGSLTLVRRYDPRVECPSGEH